MKIRSWGIIAACAAAGALGALGTAIYGRYRQEKRVEVERLLMSSHLIQTARGLIECAMEGDGRAVLISHGSLGGHDQGLAMARLLAPGFGILAVSRPGYLRTPLASGPTPEAQADLYAALLDALGIPRAALIGISAGGPAALQFALRHPQRCLGLVMVSAINQPLPPLPSPVDKLSQAQEHLLSFDFPWWLCFRFWPDTFIGLNGVSPQLLARTRRDPEKRSALQGVLRPLATASLRAQGSQNDSVQVGALPVYPVEHISTPTLIVHSLSDPLVPHAQAQWLAANVPDARLLTVREGGHLCAITHKEQVVPEVLAFLALLGLTGKHPERSET